MKRAISTLLSSLVLSTLITTSAIAAEQQPSTTNMTVNETHTIDFDRVYVEKFGA